MTHETIIRQDDLHGPEIARLLEQHLDDMRAISPPESVHALDLSSLRGPGISFWTLWHGEQLAGCVALKALGPDCGEVKSMRVDNRFRRRGLGQQLVRHVIAEARARGYRELLLETGSLPFFKPAHALYASFGFRPCGPFGDYSEDPHSIFMKLVLEQHDRTH